VRAGLFLCVLAALSPAAASAEPVSGPRETVDQSLTTTKPGAPTGLRYNASYHAAGDPKGNPPFLLKMAFYPPPGFRYDTSVPDQCTASDAELASQGAAACPAGSRLGRGTADGIFYYPFSDAIFDRYHHDTDVVNNAGEQIVLVNSEGSTVVRGKFQPDGSLVFDTTTCFPAPPPGAQCADDYILQLGTTSDIPALTRTIAGRLRSYATTPPKCPKRRYWETTIRFWWRDGSVDTVASRQPCTRPKPKKKHRRH
jgi:hypothetical protein